ncbi:MAG: DNA polymerase III subunit beta [Patescibacteria group bacterium]
MKCTILQELLSSALKVGRLAVSGRSQLPILSTVLVRVNSGKITLSTTDLYMGVRSTLTCSSEEDGLIAAPAQPFYELINSLPPGKIDIELKDTTLYLTSKNNSSQIQVMQADDFPPFPEMKGEKIELKRKDFERVIDCVPFAASRDETRPALTAVLFQLSKESQVVATDGFRLSVLNLQNSYPEQDIMVPAKALQEVYKVISDKSEENIQFQLSLQLKQVFFVLGEYEIFIRLIDAEYPPYEKIIPRKFSFIAQIDVVEFQKLIKRACIFAKDSSYVVLLKFDKSSLVVEAASTSLGKQEGSMSITSIQGEKGEIAFNAQYLLDYLNNLRTNSTDKQRKKIIFSMNDELQPAQFQSKEGDDFVYIIMPFRLQK